MVLSSDSTMPLTQAGSCGSRWLCCEEDWALQEGDWPQLHGCCADRVLWGHLAQHGLLPASQVLRPALELQVFCTGVAEMWDFKSSPTWSLLMKRALELCNSDSH